MKRAQLFYRQRIKTGSDDYDNFQVAMIKKPVKADNSVDFWERKIGYYIIAGRLTEAKNAYLKINSQRKAKLIKCFCYHLIFLFPTIYQWYQRSIRGNYSGLIYNHQNK